MGSGKLQLMWYVYMSEQGTYMFKDAKTGRISCWTKKIKID